MCNFRELLPIYGYFFQCGFEGRIWGQIVMVFVSPAKQKRDICIAFPASSSSSAAAA